MNPLFPDDDEDKQRQRAKNDAGFVISNRHGRTVQPIHGNAKPAHVPSADDAQKLGQSTPAVELIRRKLESLYEDEPDARQEAKEVAAQTPAGRSKHQQFMQELSTSGKSLAEIQTEWHRYYASLPDTEKHEVWQEFYVNNNRSPSAFTKAVQERDERKERETEAQAAVEAAHAGHTNEAVNEHYDTAISGLSTPAGIAKKTKPVPPLDLIEQAKVPESKEPEAGANMVVIADHLADSNSEFAIKGLKPKGDRRSVGSIKKQIAKKVDVRAKVPARAREHVRSLVFGLSSGAIVLLMVLFSFFNEVIIAPFIQPSRRASATPIILSSTDAAPTSSPEVIVPKINVEIPADYSQTSNDESAIESALEHGSVHYPSTVLPGQQGNAAFFAHSSNNILNPGNYKFAFVKLHELVPGDVFYLTYNSKVYTYKVFDKQIVDPSNVSVLNNVEGKPATATLITCDPPGTSLHRLVVWGEQISPNPSANEQTAPPTSTSAAPAKLAGNGPTLWNRLTNWLF